MSYYTVVLHLHMIKKFNYRRLPGLRDTKRNARLQAKHLIHFGKCYIDALSLDGKIFIGAATRYR